MMQVGSVSATLSGESLDCRQGERRKAHANHVVASELAKRKPDGIVRGEFIAVGRDEDSVRSLNAPADETDEIQCREICPVQILQNDNANALLLCEIVQDQPEEPVPRFVIARGSRRPANLCGNLMHRCECPRRRKRIAGTPQRANVMLMFPYELLHKGTLAESSFAGDEHKLAASPMCLLKASVQYVELLLTFEQVHERSLCGKVMPVGPAAWRAPSSRLKSTFRRPIKFVLQWTTR
jgi:hypothetical protein